MWWFYYWRKSGKCHQGSFHWSSKGRKVNKLNCFRDLAGKHSSSARQRKPTNLQNTAGASKDTIVLQLVPKMSRKHHRALHCSSPHVMLPATRFEGERRERGKKNKLGRSANFALDVSSKLRPNKPQNRKSNPQRHSSSPNKVPLVLTTARKWLN